MSPPIARISLGRRWHAPSTLPRSNIIGHIRSTGPLFAEDALPELPSTPCTRRSGQVPGRSTGGVEHAADLLLATALTCFVYSLEVFDSGCRSGASTQASAATAAAAIGASSVLLFTLVHGLLISNEFCQFTCVKLGEPEDPSYGWG